MSSTQTVSAIELHKIGDEKALVLCESRNILGEVHTIEPLSDGHNFGVLCVTNNILGMSYAQFHVFLKSYQVFLNLRHRYFVVGKLTGKFSRVSIIVREEFEEESLHLGVRSVLKFDLLISSAWAEEGRV